MPVRNAGVLVQSVVAEGRNVGVVQNVAAAGLTATEDHDAVAVHDAGAFPHEARALREQVPHNPGPEDPDVARKFQVAPAVQVARRDPFRPAGSFPVVRAVQFV